jgi:formate dehydrogenase major subunit
VRACEEVQGTFALTIAGRGFGSRVVAGPGEAFMDSRVRLLRRLRRRPARPRRCSEKSVIEIGQPRARVHHHLRLLRRRLLASRPRCAASSVVRMVPCQDGKANRRPLLREGPLRLGLCDAHASASLKPMIRAKHRAIRGSEVSWDEAIAYAAGEFRRIQAKYGRDSIGGITSSRCTNEETYLVQKLVRAGLRQQQRRHLRARLPLAHRLWPEAHASAPRPARRTSQSVDAGRRDRGDRRQPDRRPSGVRLAHEAAAAPGRAS